MLLRSVSRLHCTCVVLCCISLFLVPVASTAGHETSAQSRTIPVYVVLWFDTEDFILPASDDATLRLANHLTAEGVKGTFKIVGELARVLEQRNRQDVITALRLHDIGYHSNFHSLHPTPAERLRDMEWDEGVEEFDRTERGGLQDVRRIFQKTPICYGQPGSSWAVQAYGAMKRWGMPLYLDESSHVGIQSQPFWYCGVLNVLNLQEFVTRVELHQDSDLAKAEIEFQSICQKLQARGGGLVSVYYHPCEFVHQLFWDAVNFSRGMNPPRQAWRQPAVKSEGEIEQGFRNFKAYITFLKNAPGVQFVTGSELPRLYQDEAAARAFTASEILGLARDMQKGITFWNGPGFSLSPAEVFFLLNSFMASYLEKQQVPSKVALKFIYGPKRGIEGSAGLVSISKNQFAATCLDVHSALLTDGSIPSEVWIGSQAISPANYLATLAAAVEELIQKGRIGETITFRGGNFTADRFVADDSLSIWKWEIFPEGFHSPKIMELAKLQAWTLKPAILKVR
jgi:hypothetical protein